MPLGGRKHSLCVGTWKGNSQVSRATAALLAMYESSCHHPLPTLDYSGMFFGCWLVSWLGFLFVCFASFLRSNLSMLSKRPQTWDLPASGLSL